MKHKLYADFMKLNPWPVEFDEPVKEPLRQYSDANPELVGVLAKIASKLETFPPDPDYFEDPKPSLHDMRIWLTVSEGHLRFMLKVEYRLDKMTCFIVDFDPKS